MTRKLGQLPLREAVASRPATDAHGITPCFSAAVSEQLADVAIDSESPSCTGSIGALNTGRLWYRAVAQLSSVSVVEDEPLLMPDGWAMFDPKMEANKKFTGKPAVRAEGNRATSAAGLPVRGAGRGTIDSAAGTQQRTLQQFMFLQALSGQAAAACSSPKRGAIRRVVGVAAPDSQSQFGTPSESSAESSRVPAASLVRPAPAVARVPTVAAGVLASPTALLITTIDDVAAATAKYMQVRALVMARLHATP